MKRTIRSSKNSNTGASIKRSIESIVAIGMMAGMFHDLFDFPIHGSECVRGRTKDARIAFEKEMYADLIRFAREQYGIMTWEQIDMDREGGPAGVFDQKQILTLPEAERIYVASQKLWVPNTDTPGGYAWIKAQVQQIVTDRPALYGLAVCGRGVTLFGGGTNCLELKYEEMPEAWRKEMDEVYRKRPDLNAKWPHRVHPFVLTKFANAARRALDEMGRSDVQCGYGYFCSEPRDYTDEHRHWDAFADPRLSFIGVCGERSGPPTRPAWREVLREIGRRRDVTTNPWTVHSFWFTGTLRTSLLDKLSTRTREAGMAGLAGQQFGTRPFDLNGKYLSENLWQTRADWPRTENIHQFVSDWFGTGPEFERLVDWVTAMTKAEGLGDMGIILEGRLQERDPELMIDGSWKKPPLKPMHRKVCQVEVTDGRLDIGFTSTSQYPQLWRINAIEVEPVQQGAKLLPARHPDHQEASARNTFAPNENSDDRAPCPCGQ